jgi:alpha/beta superfamily hydrolase
MYGAVEKLKDLVSSLPGKNKVVIVEEADHFFVGKLAQVDQAVKDWVRERLPAPK